MSRTGRPSSPPVALMSSSQIFIARSADLPLADSPPVSAMPKPILIGSAVRAGAATAMAASAKVKPVTQARTAPPVKLFIGMILPPCMLLFLAYLNSLAFASGNVANECAGQLSTARQLLRRRRGPKRASRKTSQQDGRGDCTLQLQIAGLSNGVATKPWHLDPALLRFLKCMSARRTSRDTREQIH